MQQPSSLLITWPYHRILASRTLSVIHATPSTSLIIIYNWMISFLSILIECFHLTLVKSRETCKHSFLRNLYHYTAREKRDQSAWVRMTKHLMMMVTSMVMVKVVDLWWGVQGWSHLFKLRYQLQSFLQTYFLHPPWSSWKQRYKKWWWLHQRYYGCCWWWRRWW